MDSDRDPLALAVEDTERDNDADELGLELADWEADSDEVPEAVDEGDGEGVADDEAYDLGQGAGFYIDATEAPWAAHFKMESYVLKDLSDLLFDAFSLDADRQGITGHSMGGHGALTLAAKSPGRFRSVSAFAPICNPTASDWGQKQFTAYLGSVEAGTAHDASLLIESGALDVPLLIDTGTEDQFGDLLKTEALAAAVAKRRMEATIRLQKGYDHSYFFISTFMEDHVAFHADALWA